MARKESRANDVDNVIFSMWVDIKSLEEIVKSFHPASPLRTDIELSLKALQLAHSQLKQVANSPFL